MGGDAYSGGLTGKQRKRQEAAGQPTRYNGRCARLTATERAALEAEGRRPVIRFRIPAGRTIAFDDIEGRRLLSGMKVSNALAVLEGFAVELVADLNVPDNDNA